MLVYLDASLVEVCEKDQFSPEDFEALNHIMFSHRRGYHLVTANRKTLSYLSKSNKLDQTLRNQFMILYHEYSTLGGLKELVGSKIIVVPTNGDFKREDKFLVFGKFEKQESTFEVPLKEFLKPELLDKVKLISENRDDCKFYQFIAQKFSSLRRFPLAFTHERIPGGGNDTYKALEDAINENNISLTIVDSDKRSAECCIGTTASHAKEVFDKYSNNHLIGFEILPVHEKENLFSAEIYEKIGQKTNLESIKKLKILESSYFLESVFPYLDLKKGLHSDNYLSFFDCLFDLGNFVPSIDSEALNYEKEFIGSKKDFYDYINLQKQLPSREREWKYLIPPLGSNPLGNLDFKSLKENLLKEVDEMIQNRNPQHLIDKKRDKINAIDNISNELQDFQKEYFEFIGTIIYEWGLCNPRRTA